ncbi:hypothetical protein M942_04430 [Enterobacter ludwigii]|uniref:hypothetical protein n=1 Tax=Enterobacter ludwigii TaxID=299767 RepID=UPI0003D7B64D|nr:hypothetical protein [Enterobacter ludwigii]AHE72542.1 hypothetical protein M942_04430 [Enterobacter ludwigii]
MQVKKLQIARLYDNGHFIGLGVAVDGVLLDGHTASIVSTTAGEPAKLSVEFALGLNGQDELGDSIRIDVS